MSRLLDLARWASGGARTQRRAAIGDGGQNLVVDIDQGGRILGNGPRPRNDHGDRFTDKRDLILRQDKWRDIWGQLIGPKLQR